MLDRIESVAHKTIVEAGEIVRANIGHLSSSDIHLKGPSDYVTEIDKQCERLIMKAVRDNFPDHHIMSEETANNGLQPGYTWVIDPIDGTTNFIHGFPFVAVSIGVCLDTKPVVGLVLDPIRNELFTARKGRGAWLNGSRLSVRRNVALETALVATGFPFRTKKYMDHYLKLLNTVFSNVSGIRRAGAAALDLAYLAAGRVDGFWEIGLKAWDIAAGALLIGEAGGIITDFWGEENHLHNGNVVGGTPSVYAFLLEQVKVELVRALEAGKQP
ncbi:MAG: inositol monophosphatase [Desulfobacteraceae bacterium]|nr:inositol monophosphatase [Desulfobacteraceae bacterium]